MTLRVYDSFDQGSGAWFEARRGIVTASVIGSMITPKTVKPSNNQTSRGLITTLAAERITGHVEETYMSYDMRRGVELEHYARDAYADHYAPVDEVAFMVRDFNGTQLGFSPEVMVRDFDGTQLGFSPDGLVGETGFIEIKTRTPKIHINTIMSDQVPAANLAQLHTGLLVTGRQWADYVSYSPGMHLWTKRVYPDPVWKAAIIDALLKAEADIQLLVAEYERLTDGLPLTERVELLEDMEIQI